MIINQSSRDSRYSGVFGNVFDITRVRIIYKLITVISRRMLANIIITYVEGCDKVFLLIRGSI